jgi:hypothetical protein
VADLANKMMTTGVEAGGRRSGGFRRLSRGLHPTFELLRVDPPVVAPALMVGVLSLGTVAATMPLVRVAYLGRPELLATVATGLWLLAGLSPVIALTKCLFMGGVAWSFVVLSGADVRFRSLVSTLLYAQLFLVLQGTWITTLLWVRGSHHLGAPADLVLPTGLDLWFPDPTTVPGALAHGVTPFHLAWLVFCAVVIGKLAGGPRWRGILTAVSLWTLLAAFGVIRAVVA